MGRLPSLTSARFLAAMLVVGVHVGLLFPEGWPREVLLRGGVGVSFFFMLSGFVLAVSARGHDTRRAFYRRRFARIFPAHATTWVVAVVAVAVVNPGQLVTVAQAAALFLVQAWVPSSDVYFAANGVSWSLACEAFFYACFPFLIPRLRACGHSALGGVAAACIAIVVALGLAFDPGQGEVQQWAGYVLPVARLPEFVLGVVLACAVLQGWRPPLSAGAALSFAAVSVAGAVLLPLGPSQAAGTVVAFGLLIPALAVADREGTTTGLQGKTMQVLGEWSFALYLVHQIILNVAEELVEDPASRVVAALVLVPVSIGCAGVLFHVVERPAERRLRGGSPASARAAPW